MFPAKVAPAVLLAVAMSPALVAGDVYNIGVGIGDVTGPAAEVNMMGYANPTQTTAGLHTRTHARAYIFEDMGEGGKRTAFVSVDMGMLGFLIKDSVIQELEKDFGTNYTHQNLVLSPTHTHSATGGNMQGGLFLATSLGFVEDAYTAAVDGIVDAITMAHDNMKPAKLYWNEGKLYDASVNRSPTSYLKNPKEERDMYEDDVDHEFTQLVIEAEPEDDDSTATPLGVINWFSVHPTSMPVENRMISSDNKGLAGMMFEGKINGDDAQIGKGPFIAAFASSTLGDLSPNIIGPYCKEPGQTCNTATNLCGGRRPLFYEPCYADGPGGEDYFESTRIIAKRQFDRAWSLYQDRASYKEVSGPVSFVHQFVDMENVEVTLDDGNVTKTCPAAMGYSFAAGTADGPSPLFPQGQTEYKEFWKIITNLLSLGNLTDEQIACHHPKPILLNTAYMTWPVDWHPRIIDNQMIRIGDFAIAALPGEFTVMAGRRMRRATEEAAGDHLSKIVMAGLCNAYTHYVTTWEEYQEQRYEAASTIYGPHTLAAYLAKYTELTEALISGNTLEPGTKPTNELDNLWGLNNLGPTATMLPESNEGRNASTNYGDIFNQPRSTYYAGDTVSVTFIAGNPWLSSVTRNFESFLTVSKLNETGEGEEWEVIATDADWETKFMWSYVRGDDSGLVAPLAKKYVCNATVEWTIPQGTPRGVYKITHFGHYKEGVTSLQKKYEGESQRFSVGAAHGIRPVAALVMLIMFAVRAMAN